MTGKARERAHRHAARMAAQSDRWAVKAEHEQNVQAIQLAAAVSRGRGVTAYFPTGQRRILRTLRNFIRGR